MIKLKGYKMWSLRLPNIASSFVVRCLESAIHFFAKLGQVRPHDQVSDGRYNPLSSLSPNDRKLQIQTISCCGTLWNWNQSSCSFSVSSMGFTLFKSKFFSMYPRQTFLHSKPSMSRSYVLNISKKWDSEQTFPRVTCSNTQCVQSRWKRQWYAVIFQTNVKAQPNNGQGVPIFSCCMRSTV